MKAAVEQKVVSLAALVTALVIFALIVIEQIQIGRWLHQASEAGWIVDTSPDSLQRNIRLTFAFSLASMSLWSNRTRAIAIVTAWILFGLGALTFVAINPFDRSEPIIHLAAFCSLVTATLCIRHRRAGPLTAMLAGLFVLINYLDWFWWTARLKRFAAGRVLDPSSSLSNFLYGAHPWHVAVLIVTVCLIIWELRLWRTHPVTQAG